MDENETSSTYENSTFVSDIGTSGRSTSLSVSGSDAGVVGKQLDLVLGVNLANTPQLTGPKPYSFAPAKSGDYVGLPLQMELETDDNSDSHNDCKGQSSYSYDSTKSNSSNSSCYDTGMRNDECDIGSSDRPDWCICLKCKVMPTNQENICCVSESLERANLKDGFKPGPGCCILQSHEISIIFDPVSLGLSWQRQRRLAAFNEGHQLIFGNMNNEAYRYHAYVSYINMVYGFLGRRKRKVIPACIVNHIREMWPDPVGVYVGFKPLEDAEVSVLL